MASVSVAFSAARPSQIKKRLMARNMVGAGSVCLEVAGCGGGEMLDGKQARILTGD
jgi:hypothetical protein